MVILNESCLCLSGWFFCVFCFYKLKVDTFSSNLCPSINFWIENRRMKAEVGILCARTVRNVFQQLQNFWATCAVRAGTLQFSLLGQTQIRNFWLGDNCLQAGISSCYKKTHQTNTKTTNLQKNTPKKPHQRKTRYCYETIFMVRERPIRTKRKTNKSYQMLPKLCTNQNFIQILIG